MPGNSVHLTYTDTSNVQHTMTVVALGAGGSPAAADLAAGSNSQVIGIDFSGGMSSVVTQLNAAFGTNLQFSNPSGTAASPQRSSSGNTVNSLSATIDGYFATSGSAQLPLFTDGASTPITGAMTSSASQTTGLAGQIAVNPAVVASPSSLVAYAASTTVGDPTRPNFILNQIDQCLADLFANDRSRHRGTAL